ncbi:hypothetical protein AVEN_140248-1 [Araneus ventricosus]|uniref:Uncharacterized protein n=2 Tax=Araneus ventricosus TaxID=182803 RepID=A0A4Y2J6Z2_ARAVE|nr:hypothetical protein AVEN_140248-1 [Araneus ventricosus]
MEISEHGKEPAGVVSLKRSRLLLEKAAVSPPAAWIKKFEPIVTQDPMTIRKYLVLKKREGSWDGRCHFEPWSDDKDGTLAGTLSKLPHHTSGGTLGTADLLENWVSSLEPSGPETETLSLCR